MIRTNYLKALPAALLALGFAAGAAAQGSSSTAQPNAAGASSAPTQGTNLPSATGRASKGGKSSLSHADRKFIEEAAKGGMAEVALAKVAEQRASSPEVKQFAQKMEQDHSKANEQLRELAQAKGVTMPGAPKAGEKHEESKLSKLQGQDFDRAYMDHMVKDHEKDVKEFRKEAQKAKDADVKNFAQQTAPILEEHLQLAQNADAAVGGKAAKKADKQARNGASPNAGNTKTSMR
jgi:putative membrane protein